MGKCLEETQRRTSRKLLQPFCDSHVVICDFDTTKKDIETIHDEGRVKVCQCRCCEVVQDRHADRSIQ